MSYRIVIFILLYLTSCLVKCQVTEQAVISVSSATTRQNGDTGDQTGDPGCRNLFFAISFISVFMYLLSLSLTDFIAREKIPEVYNNRKVEKANIILSKYLIKVIFGRWSPNLEFKDTLLSFEFNTLDTKLTASSFTIPTDWLKKLMDFVGTRENPILKSIKFWVYQPESLGLISTVKLSMKNFKNANSFIYIEAIEVSKVSDDKIQVITIQKNVHFTGGNPKPLPIELAFKQNAKVIPYDGYIPYLSFCDFFYFYITYLDTCYLAVNFLPFDLLKRGTSFSKLLINSLVNCGTCTLFILLVAIFYLLFIKHYLSVRHNSEIFQAINIIFLAALWIAIFIVNYFVCESTTNFGARKLDLLYELGILQLLFPVTLFFLWIISKIFKYRAIRNMIARTADLESTPISSVVETSAHSQGYISKRVSDIKETSQSLPKSTKLGAKKLSLGGKSSRPTDESPLKRVDSDNSIGSGYYHQMITATKHVRSISQYGELLRQ